MFVGDLVWAYGARGLILKTEYGMHSTEHFVFWFDDMSDPSWIPQKHLIKVC